MDELLEAIESLDLTACGFVAFVLWIVGHKLTDSRPRTRRACERIGLIAFLGVFLLSFGSASKTGEFVQFAVCGAIFGFAVTGVGCIIFPIVNFFWGLFILAPQRRLRQWSDWRNSDSERRRAEVESQRRAMERAEADRRAEEENRRGAPERERQRAAAAEAQVRKEKARANCELTYRLYGPEIRERFTKKMLDEYVAKYMGDEKDVDFVEDHARQLTELMMHHKEKVAPTEQFRTLEDVIRWYAQQKKVIESSVNDEELRQTLLGDLHARYTDLSMAMLEKSGG